LFGFLSCLFQPAPYSSASFYFALLNRVIWVLCLYFSSDLFLRPL
jgi:hypothetical protein